MIVVPLLYQINQVQVVAVEVGEATVAVEVEVAWVHLLWD